MRLSTVYVLDSWLPKLTSVTHPPTMHAVARMTRLVTFSLRTKLAKKTLETNCTDPSAASSDCAAKPNDAKLARLPTTNITTPTCHCQNVLMDLRSSSSSADASRLLWPSFITLVPRLIITLPHKLIIAPITHIAPCPPSPSAEGGGGDSKASIEAGHLAGRGAARHRPTGGDPPCLQGARPRGPGKARSGEAVLDSPSSGAKEERCL
mmetsp:Transcript_54292/g.172380  ORF Transcript_54292/g.172380 Transcript_54292/m.172380 type:complete len:208 (-) Transcript_54292:310-933(-)